MEAGWGRYNILRPEVVESIFMLWRITGDEKYKEWGWTIFQAFQKWAKVCRSSSPYPSPLNPAPGQIHVRAHMDRCSTLATCPSPLSVPPLSGFQNVCAKHCPCCLAMNSIRPPAYCA